MQGVIKSYDPATKDGIVVRDTDLAEFDLSRQELDGSLFRMLRQGQRVCFELDDQGLASAGGWSFPSGHSSGALVAYGMLAYVLPKLNPATNHKQKY